MNFRGHDIVQFLQDHICLGEIQQDISVVKHLLSIKVIILKVTYLQAAF